MTKELSCTLAPSCICRNCWPLGYYYCARCGAQYVAHPNQNCEEYDAIDPMCPTGECTGTCDPEAHGA
jgi:hypothetical protein